MNDTVSPRPIPVSASVAAPPSTRTSKRTRNTALIVACALFMQSLDSTVIATALPTMARSFGADPVHMNVALTSYLLSLAVFIPASGWIADRYGARTVFRNAVILFTIGSILCGRAGSLTFLVAARVIQGIGGAMMVPVGRLVLLRRVPKAELVAATAWISAPALIGPLVGPPLGGLLVTYASWRWIFDINIPIGILGVVLITLFIDDVQEPARPRFDAWGLLFSAICLCAVMIGLETIGRGIVSPLVTTGLLATGAAAAVAYAVHAHHHPAPLLDFSLMRIPTFMVAVVAGTLFRIGIGAIPFLLPLMIQLGFGRDAAQSGAITFSAAVGAIVMKPAAMVTLRRLGFRNTLVANGVLSALFTGIMAAFRPDWPVAFIYLALLAGGFFRSLQFTAFNSLAFGDIPRARMSAATSLYSTIQQVSLTLGISVGAAALASAMALAGHEQPALSDFTVGFLVVSVIALLAAPVAMCMPADAGEEMSGRLRRED